MTNYETRIGKIESDINLLKWMSGFNVAMTVAILFKVLSVGETSEVGVQSRCRLALLRTLKPGRASR